MRPAILQPGDITYKLPISQEIVGLIVGFKGTTIKGIQSDSNTYIVTPSRNQSPIFEITGSPINVEMAKTLINSHINSRTTINRGPKYDFLNCFNKSSIHSSQIAQNVTNNNSYLATFTNDYSFPDNNDWNFQKMSKIDLIKPIPTTVNKAVGAEINLLRRSRCSFCKIKEVKAAMLPCKHEMFCIDCANKVSTSINPICVVCGTILESAILIFKK